MESLSAVVAIGYYGEVGSLSPSCRIYPPACKPYGLEAEPEAADFI
jgi:hypothetical protein